MTSASHLQPEVRTADQGAAAALRAEVLMHASDQLQHTINSHLAAANALFGGVLPIAVGFFLFAEPDSRLSPASLAAGLVVVVSLVCIFNAGLWVEISRAVAYKYGVLYPELFEIASIRGENYGQYLVRSIRRRPTYETFLFHGLVGSVTLGIGSWSCLTGSSDGGGLRITAVGLALLAACTAYFVAAPQIKRDMAELVAGSEPPDLAPFRGLNSAQPPARKPE